MAIRFHAAAACAAFVLACASSAPRAQTVIPPVSGVGPHPVGCTNVEQDFSRVPAGDTADMYWRGVASDGTERYVDTLLVSPANALTRTFVAPGDADLYDRWAGTAVDYVFIACYPTTAANTRADYPLPGGGVVPRMQRGAEAPILPAGPVAFPVIVDSHGYAGSPLSDAYLAAMVSLASWGYVTVAPFHGDLRYSVLGPQDKRAGAKIHVPIWSEFVAMQALRALSASAALDALFARPEWRDRLDPARIGAFGVSQGGETLMLLGGAELTYDAFNLDRHKQVTRDTRVRAAVGYVPYFGVQTVPAFGTGQAGASGVLLPFLALSGTSDPIAPADVVRAALDRMAGPRGHVLLNGQGHDLDPGSGADIATWTLTFLAAWVGGDQAARARLATVDHVEGGLDDHKVLYVDPAGAPVAGVVVDTIEFHSAALDHYFITAFPEEAAALDAGVPPGWTRTGKSFKAWKSGTGPGSEACRFFGTPGRGPNSHFYTIDAAECDKVKANPDWTFEALAFRAVAPLSTGCAAEYATVTRLYNNGMGGQANHRYLTDPADIDATVGLGWSVEGPVFCVPR
jgi:hypothetical protein